MIDLQTLSDFIQFDRLYRRLRRMKPIESSFLLSPSFAPVFVLSTGRCGTQTLAALLRMVPSLFSYHEPRPLLFNLSRLAYASDSATEESSTEVLSEAFLLARLPYLERAYMCGRNYAETSPQLAFLAPAIVAAIPQARFIHLVRNPFDVVRSGMERRWYVDNANDRWRITPSAGSPYAANWPSMPDPCKIAWLWKETNDVITQDLSQISPHKKISLKSEDIYAGDSESLARLYSFVGAEVPSANKLSQVLGRKLNAQRQKSGNLESEPHPPWMSEIQNILGDPGESQSHT